MTVRHEKVILDLEDRFSRPMAQAAATTALLNRELKDLSGSAVKTRASASGIDRDVTKIGASAEKSGKQIDKLSGRLALFAQAAAVLGPALVPIGAAAVPAIAGMATQLTLTAAAAGTAMLAFNGMGEGLKTLKAYQLEPTAENLDKMRLAMDKLGPAGEEFARFLSGIGPMLSQLSMTARGGMFPGMQEGITSLLTLLPQVNRIVGEIATAMGDLSAQAGAGLSGERFAAFFDYLESDARPILMEMGRTIGNFADGFASTLVALGPLTASFSSGLEGMSAAFADWSHSLGSSDSFAAFVSYVQQSGPMVLDLLGSMVQMFVGIAQAAAPVGAVVVPALTILADAIAAIAKSDIGTPLFAGLAALSLLSRATAAYGGIAKTAFGAATIGSVKGLGAALTTVTTAQERATMSASALAKSEAARNATMREGLATFGKTAALMGGLTLATTGAAEGMGLANTASMALMGTMAGPWGAAVGGGVGLAMDLAHANDDLAASFTSLKVAMGGATPTPNGMAALDAQIESSRARLDQFTAEMEEYSARGGNAIFQLLNPSQSIAGFKNEIEGLFGASDVEEYAASLEAAKAKQAELASQSTLTGASSSELAQAMDQAAQAGYHEAAGIQASIDAMRAKRDEALRGENAELNYASALIDGREAARANGRVLRANGDLINRNSKEAIAAKGSLLGMASGWNGLSDSAKNTRGAHRAAINTFVAVATQMGMNAGAARRYARSLMEIPPRRVTDVQLHTDAASRAASAIKAQLASIDRNVDIYIRAHTTRLPSVSGFGPQITSARGNLFESVRAYANGDIANGHQPELAGPGPTRIWREPETAGEAYVPLANDSRRPRAKSILEQTASMFGGVVEWYADGGINGRQRPTGSPGSPGLDRANRAADRLAGSLARAKKALDAETNKRQELVSKRTELSSGIKDGLRTDLFAAPENPWAANATGGVMGTLKSDIGRARRLARLIKELRSKGLDGPALTEIIATGDVERAQLYADMSRKGLNRFENLYEQRDKALRQAGMAGGNAVFGKEIRETNHELRQLRNDVKRLEHAVKHHGPKATGHEVGKAINDGASKGAGRGRR